MSRTLPVVLLLSCLSTGCGSAGDRAGGLQVIDVVGNLGTYHAVPMSELISEVEYIPLETSTEYLVDRRSKAIIADTLIFVVARNQCSAFTREGKFVAHIGRTGRGPGEFTSLYEVSVDKEGRYIYLETPLNVLQYTWDGKFVREIEIPMSREQEGYGTIAPSRIGFLRDSLLMGHINNSTGQEPHSWVVFDCDGTVVKTFDNPVRIEKDTFKSFVFISSPPQTVSGDTFVKVWMNDTLYRIDPGLVISPAFVFDLGRYTYPVNDYMSSSLSASIKIHMNSVSIDTQNMTVTSDRIFFTAYVGNDTGILTPHTVGPFTDQIHPVLGMYFINEGTTRLLDSDSFDFRMGLMNDIDGGFSFWPRYYNEVENELVDVWEAYEMKELLTEEYFAAHPAKDPAAHARLRALVENLEETDNPVIVIAKLKK